MFLPIITGTVLIRYHWVLAIADVVIKKYILTPNRIMTIQRGQRIIKLVFQKYGYTTNTTLFHSTLTKWFLGTRK